MNTNIDTGMTTQVNDNLDSFAYRNYLAYICSQIYEEKFKKEDMEKISSFVMKFRENDPTPQSLLSLIDDFQIIVNRIKNKKPKLYRSLSNFSEILQDYLHQEREVKMDVFLKCVCIKILRPLTA